VETLHRAGKDVGMLRVFSMAFRAFIGFACPVFFLGAVLVWLVTLPFDRRRTPFVARRARSALAEP
jgi:hypothetical protein